MINKVKLKGTIISYCEYFFATKGDEYYKVDVEVKRKSGNIDIVPVVIPRRYIDPNADYRTLRISLNGTIQTKHMGSHLKMYVYTTDSSIYYSEDEIEDINEVEFSGIMKDKNFRKTSLNNIDIVDVYFLSKQYSRHKKIEYYLPCIAWNTMAKTIDKMEINTPIIAKGRFQSKKYIKNDEERIAYEISLSELNVI